MCGGPFVFFACFWVFYLFFFSFYVNKISILKSQEKKCILMLQFCLVVRLYFVSVGFGVDIDCKIKMKNYYFKWA